MTTRNATISPALPCGGDPLDRVCGVEVPKPMDLSFEPSNLCRACLPRPQGLVKLEAR